MTDDYVKFLRMARTMQDRDHEIQRAIRKVQRAQHGVVALRFSKNARRMEIEIEDEPYMDSVRVYPG